MEAYCLAAPAGFAAATGIINKFADAQQVLADLIIKALAFVDVHEGHLSAQVYAQKFKASGVDLSVESVESAIHAAVFLLRGALKFSVAPATLKDTIVSSTDVCGPCAEVFALGLAHYSKTKARKSERKAAEAEADDAGAMSGGLTARAAASSGRVVGLDWKVGVRVASSRCSDLGSAFVTLRLKIADHDGAIKVVPVDLSIAEFKSFASTLREIGGVLDTV